MTLERAKQLLQVQAGFGGFYNANSSKLILSEVMREHGQQAVDELIVELELDRIFGFRTGTRFEGGLALGTDKGRESGLENR
ncbi:MAG: hypothetical protein ACK4N4_00080 [Burkholderiales bacterium]